MTHCIKPIVLGFLFTLLLQQARAQLTFKGWGLYGSGTSSAHEYINLDASKMTLALNPRYFYTRNHQSKEYLSWGAGLFADWQIKGPLRYQSELAYTNKGAQERAYLNIFTNQRQESFQSNTYTYISSHHFLKYYVKPMALYFMSGLRFEYLLTSSTPVFNEFSGDFPKFWYSWDASAGYEFPIKKRCHGFVELHYNPDLLWHYHRQIRIKNRTLELRAGIVIRERKRRIDDCNAPKYNGPKYPM